MSRPRPLELVVARYREDLRWLRRVPTAFQVTVYDKGGDLPAAHHLPNVGREAHTYLHHIVEHYHRLAELTVFCQGKPFDHAQNFHHTLRRLAAGETVPDGFLWLGFLVDRDDVTGGRLFRQWSKNVDGRPLRLDDFHRLVWGRPAPPEVTFFPGGQFAVSASVVHRSPRSFYQQARQVAAGFPDAAHCFERTWDRVFQVEGIPDDLRRRNPPVYLKPIRRLMAGNGGAE